MFQPVFISSDDYFSTPIHFLRVFKKSVENICWLLIDGALISSKHLAIIPNIDKYWNSHQPKIAFFRRSSLSIDVPLVLTKDLSVTHQINCMNISWGLSHESRIRKDSAASSPLWTKHRNIILLIGSSNQFQNYEFWIFMNFIANQIWQKTNN